MEKLLEFFDLHQPVSFKIITGEKIVFHGSNDDLDELKQEFTDEYELLKNGTYILSVGTTDKFRHSKSPTKSFRKSTGLNTNNMNQSTGNQNGIFTREDIENAKKEAYQQGQKDARITNLEYRINKQDDRLENFIKVVSKKFDELDGSPDEDVTEKMTKLIGTFSDAKDAMANFK